MIRCRRTFAILCSIAASLAGCRFAPELKDKPAEAAEAAEVIDLNAVMARAGEAKRPVVILVGELGHRGSDRAAGDLLKNQASRSNADSMEFLRIDLSASPNRATAARFHVAQTPVLVCLSSTGVIVSRDQGTITAELLARRLDDLVKRAADLDARYAALLDGVNSSKELLVSRRAMADFLLAQQNDLEAIPYLNELADSDLAEPTDRVGAWVSMARAHLWIGEPEKARHEAKELIATLGPTTPEAIAGGNLMLGTQDATAKRFALARQEFHAAIAAAPSSDYAKQAGNALAQLPPESK